MKYKKDGQRIFRGEKYTVKVKWIYASPLLDGQRGWEYEPMNKHTLTLDLYKTPKNKYTALSRNLIQYERREYNRNEAEQFREDKLMNQGHTVIYTKKSLI